MPSLEREAESQAKRDIAKQSEEGAEDLRHQIFEDGAKTRKAEKEKESRARAAEVESVKGRPQEAEKYSELIAEKKELEKSLEMKKTDLKKRENEIDDELYEKLPQDIKNLQNNYKKNVQLLEKLEELSKDGNKVTDNHLTRISELVDDGNSDAQELKRAIEERKSLQGNLEKYQREDKSLVGKIKVVLGLVDRKKEAETKKDNYKEKIEDTQGKIRAKEQEIEQKLSKINEKIRVKNAKDNKELEDYDKKYISDVESMTSTDQTLISINGEIKKIEKEIESKSTEIDKLKVTIAAKYPDTLVYNKTLDMFIRKQNTSEGSRQPNPSDFRLPVRKRGNRVGTHKEQGADNVEKTKKQVIAKQNSDSNEMTPELPRQGLGRR
ncbi:MAG: hypothetical protein VX737_01155 [Pseudomonadota bacterium]|nr:hypothetical protein [Pseudomonadota bacterium]